MRDDILSSIRSVPTSYFIYSSLSLYTERCGGEIPGTWFLRALATVGRAEGAIRQELFRMERSHELTARRAGRVKFYRAAPAALAEIAAGRRKIFARPRASWDHRWTLLQFQLDGRHRVERDRLRSMLEVEGFAPRGPGAFIHPRPLAPALWNAIESLGIADRVTVFRGSVTTGISDRAFASRSWDLSDVAKGYADFLRRFAPIARSRAPIGAERAFALRFAVVFDYLGTAWRDPELPAALLPANWPGIEARDIARALYRRLLPASLAHADALLLPTARRRVTAPHSNKQAS